MSDGTRDKYIKIEYTPVRGRAKKLIEGWKKFEADLIDWVPPAVAEAKLTAYEPPKLPALKLEISQEIVSQNVDAFVVRATDFIDSIRTDLQTDQDFVDAEANVKACKKAEEAIAAARNQVLNGSADITELMDALDSIEGKLRSTRLQLDKAVKSEKEARKREILNQYQQKFNDYRAGLESELHGYRLEIDPDLAAATKGLRTLASIEQKASQAYDAAEEHALIRADQVMANWEAIPESAQHLFNDFARIGDMDAQGFAALVNQRIQEENERVAAREAAKAAREAAESAQEAPKPAQSDEIPAKAAPATPETPTAQNTSSQDNFDGWWDSSPRATRAHAPRCPDGLEGRAGRGAILMSDDGPVDFVDAKKAIRITERLIDWQAKQPDALAVDEWICAYWGMLYALLDEAPDQERHLHVLLQAILAKLVAGGWYIPADISGGGNAPGSATKH